MPRGLILAIESSCDETAAAVVQQGSHTLSSVVASQIATHARYGGVVPEIASREHLRAIVPVVRAALAEAHVTLNDLDAIAVTSGPGLAGALLVGITYAKALAFAAGLPLIAVNHLEGHIHAVLLNERESSIKAAGKLQGTGEMKGKGYSVKGTGFSPYIEPADEVGALAPEGIHPQLAAQSAGSLETTPSTSLQRLGRSPAGPPDAQSALALVVSGGHTHLYAVRPLENTWHYTLVGRTLDDAAGEAYDKVAKLLGLGYPGGPWIDALALHGNPRAVPFAFAQIKSKAHLRGAAPRTKAARTSPIASLDPRFLFSFSGIKTAVLRYVELHNLRPEAESRRYALFTGPDAPGASNMPIMSGTEATFGNREPSHVRRAPGAPGPSHLGTWDSTQPRPSTTGPAIDDALRHMEQQTLDLIASFQRAVVGDLMKKTFLAAESLGAKRILVTGGVAANRELRSRFAAEAARLGLSVSFPTLALSTDNAAMIAAAAWPKFLARSFAPADLSGDPALAL
jgi:N6-L-threonylcarbamoyladenine synthase